MKGKEMTNRGKQIVSKVALLLWQHSDPERKQTRCRDEKKRMEHSDERDGELNGLGKTVGRTERGRQGILGGVLQFEMWRLQNHTHARVFTFSTYLLSLKAVDD